MTKTSFNIFRDSRYGRLRALWRLLLQVGLFGTLSLLLVGCATFALAFSTTTTTSSGDTSQSIAALAENPISGGLIAMATLGAAVASVWLGGKYLDKRQFVDFGLHIERAWWIDLGFGLALGAVLMALIFLVERVAGWVTIDSYFRTPATILFPLAIAFRLLAFVCVGVYEELLFRGYLLKNLSEGLRSVPRLGDRGAVVASVLFTSALFGLAHASNPNSTVVSTITLTLAGIFLALPYALTGSLAIPIGLHITWNFFQGNVFGFPVSGTPANSTTFIAIDQGGDVLLTGGAFGPEAGLIGLAAILLGCGLILAWVRARQGRVAVQAALAVPEPRTTLV